MPKYDYQLQRSEDNSFSSMGSENNDSFELFPEKESEVS